MDRNCSVFPNNLWEMLLKEQCHEIFHFRFFHRTTPCWALINHLKYFQSLFQIRQVLRISSLTRRYCSGLYDILEGRSIDLGKPWGGGKLEWGGQFTSNLGPGWTRISPRKEEGFQVSREGLRRKGN
jgi:hypothetical protein